MGKKKKKQDKKIVLATLDTETRGMFGDIFKLGFYDGENYYSCYNFNELIPILEENYKDVDLHVYAHNLDFDLSKVAPELCKKYTLDFSSSIFINGSAATIKTDLFTLHDSYKLLPSSLARLCKDFDLGNESKRDMEEEVKSKGLAIYNSDGTFNKKLSMGNYFMNISPDDPELNIYLKYDCTSLYKILTIVEDISGITLDKLVKCPTAAALAMSVYKTFYKEDYDLATSTNYRGEFGRFIENFIRQGYYGGRVEVFIPHMIEGGKHYDVNSEYPYAMKTCKFPVGHPILLHGERAAYNWGFWNRHAKGGGFLWCDVYVPENTYIPVLPVHDVTGKLIFPVGRLSGVWSYIELREAVKHGAKITKIHEAVYFEQMEYIFRDYIKQFEKIKTTSKGAKRAFAKLCQNSLYGKFGMKRERTCYANIQDLDKIIEDKKPYRIHKYNRNISGVQFIECIEEATATYIQPQIAAYTTAYARIILHRGLMVQEKRGRVYYCDTDSCAGTAEMPPEMVHDTEYGKWKLETEIEKAIFLQPKFYIEKDVKGELNIKAKGIPHEIMDKFTYDDYEHWLQDFKDKKKARIEIFNNLESRQKFMSSMKKGDDLNKCIQMKKTINLLLEQKRDIDYVNNTSRPHTRIQWGEGVEVQPEVLHDVFTKKLAEMNDDENELLKCIKQFGYIRWIKDTDPYFKEFLQIDLNTTKRYFRKNKKCLDLITWCEKSGWEVTELLQEMI